MYKPNRKNKELARDEQGTILMSKENLRIICEGEEGCYEIPDLNEKIYLHFKGFKKIENLDEYFNIKSLWLESNCIRKIENLGSLTKLICLFLQNNMIEEMAGFENLVNLQILNISHNKIKQISGLSTLTNLNNLDISYNHLTSVESIMHLSEVPSLTNIDLSNNYFDYHVDFLETFIKLPNLACLYLRNMALTRETPNYRKSYISHLTNLKYLDDRPVVPEERKIAEAWGKGGKEAEGEVRRLLNEEKLDNQKKVAEEYRKRSEETRQKRLFLYDKTIKEYDIDLEKLKEAKQNAIKQGKNEHYVGMFQEDIDIQEKKIKELKESIDNLSLYKPDPYRSFTTSRNEDGEVIVWHKSREEAKYIKENLIENKSIIEEKMEKNEKGTIFENFENSKENNQDYDNPEKNPKKEEEKEEIMQVKNVWEALKEGSEELVCKRKEEDWESEYDNLLEALLERYKFDFTKAKEEFNRVVFEVDRKMGKENNKAFDEKELRMRWTQKERSLRGVKKNDFIDLDDLD